MLQFSGLSDAAAGDMTEASGAAYDNDSIQDNLSNDVPLSSSEGASYDPNIDRDPATPTSTYPTSTYYPSSAPSGAAYGAPSGQPYGAPIAPRPPVLPVASSLFPSTIAGIPTGALVIVGVIGFGLFLFLAERGTARGSVAA